jgi:hypothetical protein
VAVRLAGMPATNAITTGIGYVYVTPPALAAGKAAGADLVSLLQAEGLDLHQDDEEGKTIWNAQGRRDIIRSGQNASTNVSDLLLAVAGRHLP